MEKLKNFFRPKTKIEDIETKNTPSFPETLNRKNFPEGIIGDITRSLAAREIDKDLYFTVVPKELENIIREADSDYYVVDKLQALLDCLEKEKWMSFSQVDVEKLNLQLHVSEAAAKIKKIEEEDNIMARQYSKLD